MFGTSTVGNLLQKGVHVLPALLNVVGHLRDKTAGRHGAPRPPMTDVGTETAFRLEKAQAFPKK